MLTDFNCIKDLLNKHIEILNKEELSNKDIKFLLDTLPKILTIKDYINNKNDLNKHDLLIELEKNIQKIIDLANRHKKQILEELSKFQNKQKAFYSYNINDFNIKSFSKKV